MRAGNLNPRGPEGGKGVFGIMTRLWETQEDTQMSREHFMNVSTKQDRIAEIAKKYPDQAILSLAHYIDLEWLYVAYLKTRKDGAKGIDGQSAEEYSLNLQINLKNLLNKFKSGSYRAPAVRRVYIPKGNGNDTRPLGIPTFEDKVLQRAVLMVLTPVWEQEFYEFSYGFREGRGAHQAIKSLRNQCMQFAGGWVIDLDIQKYFDSIDHRLLKGVVKQRVCDGVITRILGKWLKAGVMENKLISYSKTGSPQGGVISPLLSNIYLHEVLDNWFVQGVQPRLKGKSTIVRFADDGVLVFQNKEDALRVLKVLPERFGRYKLTLHPEKTRLVQFVKPHRNNSDNDKPGTFTFLGFTLYWGKTRKGAFVVKCKTDEGKLSKSIKSLYVWLKINRHQKLKVQWNKLKRSVIGHYAYFGVSFNLRSLNIFLTQVKISWFKWLKRRSQKSRFTWAKFQHLSRHYPLPHPRIYHSLWSKA